MLVQIEEAKCAIRKLPCVTVLAPVRAVCDKGRGWQASLSCYGCQEYGSCPKKQEPAVRLSREHRTELACLQELRKRLQDRHDSHCAQADVAPETWFLWTQRRKSMLLNKKCKGCNRCYTPRELEHILQLPMPMRNVRSTHGTTGTSVVRAWAWLCVTW